MRWIPDIHIDSLPASQAADLSVFMDPPIVTEMIAGAIFGHHEILGMLGTDTWVESLVDHVWAAIEAPPVPAQAPFLSGESQAVAVQRSRR